MSDLKNIMDRVNKLSLLIEQSKAKENVIKESNYYLVFSDEAQRELARQKQKRVTERLCNRAKYYKKVLSNILINQQI